MQEHRVEITLTACDLALDHAEDLGSLAVVVVDFVVVVEGAFVVVGTVVEIGFVVVVVVEGGLVVLVVVVVGGTVVEIGLVVVVKCLYVSLCVH